MKIEIKYSNGTGILKKETFHNAGYEYTGNFLIIIEHGNHHIHPLDKIGSLTCEIEVKEDPFDPADSPIS